MAKTNNFSEWDLVCDVERRIITCNGTSGTSVIYTKHGIVLAFWQEGMEGTLLDFVWRGRRYWRRWDYVFAERTLTTLAKRLAADVVGSTDHGAKEGGDELQITKITL